MPADRAAFDHFGGALSISGNMAVVGAKDQDTDSSGNNAMLGAGAAYIFEPDLNNVWTQRQKVTAKNRQLLNGFAYNISIRGHRIIASTGESLDTNGNNFISGSGAAYIFEYDSIANYWNSRSEIVASERISNDGFGTAAAIEGDWAMVGTFARNTDSVGLHPLNNAGMCYVFKMVASGHWVETQRIWPHDRQKEAQFGIAVSMSGDYAAIGAGFKQDSVGSTIVSQGAAYIYHRIGNTWYESQEISSPDAYFYNDNFAYSLDISNGRLIAGNDGNRTDLSGNNPLPGAGAAYMYEYGWQGVEAIGVNKDALHVFPNPSAGDFTIESSMRTGVIQLYNMLGEVIYETAFSNSAKNKMSLKNISPGIYFISLTDAENKRQLRAKVVIE